MEPFFKLASTSGLKILTQLMSELYAHEQLPFDEGVVSSTLELILNHDAYGQIYLIYNKEDLIGYFVVTFGFSLEWNGRDAFIDELYIREQYRHQGIGKKSLKFVEEICQKLGIKALHLEVQRKNLKAQALYRQAGFIDLDRYLLTKRI